MKKTQITDTIRNIRKEIVSYLSIMVIGLLAVASYLGINFAANALRDNADAFYSEHNFREIEIASTMLLSKEDMDTFRNTEGIADVEGIYMAAGKLILTDKNISVNVVSLSERLNKAELVEGRLPGAANECVIEKELLESLSLSIGDHVSITDSAGQILTYLKNRDYTITGTVLHPDHIALNAYVPGSRYILVDKQAFDLEALDGCFMEAEIALEGTEGISMFSKEYAALVDQAKERLEPLNDTLSKEREAAVRGKMQEKINEGEAKLADAKKQLEDSRALLDENKKKLEDGRVQLEELQKQLEDGKVQLDNGEKELADALVLLEDAKAQLDSGKEQLEWGYSQLVQAWEQLNSAKEQLDAGWVALQDGAQQLATSNSQLVDGYNLAEDKKTDARNLIRDAVAEVIGQEQADQISWAAPVYISDAGDPSTSISIFNITDSIAVDLSITLDRRLEDAVRTVLQIIGEEARYDEVIDKLEHNQGFEEINSMYNTVVEKLEQWNSGHEQYIAGRAEYQSKEADYYSGLDQYNAGLDQYNASLEEYNSKEALYYQGLEEYNAGLEQYYEGRQTLDEKWEEYRTGLEKFQDGQAQIENGEKELSEGEVKYQDGLKQYEEGLEELNDAKKQLEDLPGCHFVMTDRNGNGGFDHIDYSSSNLGSIGITFALLFILVGALVIYVTMGRIIGEQRPLVGTEKALGFFGREILSKYLIFGTSATLLGMLIGTLVGCLVLQNIAVQAHGKFYCLGTMSLSFRPVTFIIVIAAGIILSAFAVWWACRRLLKQTAKDLMQYEAPAARKTKTSGSAFSEASLYSRLIVRNMTADWKRVLITIVSIAGCCTLLVIGFFLYNSINNAIKRQYERITLFDQSVTYDPGASDKAEEEITALFEQKGIRVFQHLGKYVSYDTNEGMSLALLTCGDLTEIGDYFTIRNVADGSLVDPDSDGVIIPKKMADWNGLSQGDTLTMYDSDMTQVQVSISAIYDNYLGRYMFMSEKAYENAFGRKPVHNEVWLNTDLSKQDLNGMLDSIKGFDSITSKTDIKSLFSSVASVLSVITLVMIVAAGMMAYFVLLNLINMYLKKKLKELVVMRINGFTVKEVIKYVATENVITTIIGILLGLAAGTVLGNLIIQSLEQPGSGFVHGIDIPSLVFATLLTFVFAAVINIIALRKVKNLKLNDF